MNRDVSERRLTPRQPFIVCARSQEICDGHHRHSWHSTYIDV